MKQQRRARGEGPALGHTLETRTALAPEVSLARDHHGGRLHQRGKLFPFGCVTDVTTMPCGAASADTAVAHCGRSHIVGGPADIARGWWFALGATLSDY